MENPAPGSMRWDVEPFRDLAWSVLADLHKSYNLGGGHLLIGWVAAVGVAALFGPYRRSFALISFG